MALRELNEALPSTLFVGSLGRDLWVAYPDGMDEDKARDETRSALAALGERGIRGVRLA